MIPALDHVFICCADGAPEAERLLRLGIKEGLPNTHPGQGTKCRRFFFENEYLELLWISDPREAQSETVRRTRLWERWSMRHSGACPFGIVLRPGARATECDPPFPTWSYHPKYLAPNLAIELALDTPLCEPEFFFLPFAKQNDRLARAVREHTIEASEITALRIGIPTPGAHSAPAAMLESAGIVTFDVADQYLMTMVFDCNTSGKIADLRPELPLVLRW